jgi:TorA maturation chaperone TorD
MVNLSRDRFHSHSASHEVRTAPGPDDQARADLYAVLARLLLAPPDASLLAALANSAPIIAQGGAPALARCWEDLSLASSVMDAGAVAAEFNSLFVSIGTPPVDPYGSRYLAGFINDTPLAELRADLARLGLRRARGVVEFEDHLGALCETMRVLVAGAPGIDSAPIAQQEMFFDRHILPWCGRALDDIASADGANYYRLVARLGAAFLALETEAFALGAPADAYSEHA